MSRARPFAAVALALLACLVVAGCAGGGDGTGRSAADTGRIEQTILPEGEKAGGSGTTDGGKADAAAGNGELRGTVRDDAGLAMQGALVSLLGTPFSATADAEGGFRFVNVSSGTHGLRVLGDTSVYRVHEGEVTVVADRVTVVTVTLVPLDDRGPGYRPHLHDYWGDNTELELFSMDLDFGKAGFPQYGAAGDLLSRTYSASQGTYLPFSIPERDDGGPPIVLPGTKEIRFTVSWDTGDVSVDRFQLAYHPGDQRFRDLLAENGAAFTIEVEPEDADNGHQSFSLWQFRIRAQPRQAPPNTIFGPVHVEAILVKGTLPIDPPHEDFWAGNATYLSRSWDTAVPGPGSTCCDDNARIKVSADAKRLVPPGTKSLAIRFGFASTQAPGTAADLEWELLAKPANLPPGAPLSEYRVLAHATTATGLKTYDVPVAPGETDAFYQTNSNWLFVIRQVGDWPYAVAESNHRFNLEIVAHKDPAFA